MMFRASLAIPERQRVRRLLVLLGAAALLQAGAILYTSGAQADVHDGKPIPTVDPVDLPRFMGAWYVHAHIPIPFTGDAYNAVERYRLNDEGRVDVLYTYYQGGFDGKLKIARPTGFPDEGEKEGTWGMRFVWPFKADYRIAYLDPDYQRTIIAREARDFVWIMSRSPELDPEIYADLVERVVEMGYDAENLQRVPQQPLDERRPIEDVQTFEAQDSAS